MPRGQLIFRFSLARSREKESGRLAADSKLCSTRQSGSNSSPPKAPRSGQTPPDRSPGRLSQLQVKTMPHRRVLRLPTPRALVPCSSSQSPDPGRRGAGSGGIVWWSSARAGFPMETLASGACRRAHIPWRIWWGWGHSWDWGYHWSRQVQGNVAKAACEPRYLSMALSLSLTSDPSPLHPPSLSPTPDAALGKAKTAQSLQPLNPLSSVPLGSDHIAFRVEAPLIPVPTLHCRVTPPWERAFA